MPDTASIGAGLDSTRLDLDETALRERRRKQAAARSNLAALMCERYGVDPSIDPHPATLDEKYAAAEFAELAAILGLQPERTTTTGTCRRCGGSRPLAASSRSTSGTGGGYGGYKTGMCWWCSNDRERPADAQPAVQRRTHDTTPTTRGSRPYHGGTGHCPACQREYHLTGEGRLRPHPGWTDRNGAPVRLRTECPGTGELSREHADLAQLVEAMPS